MPKIHLYGELKDLLPPEYNGVFECSFVRPTEAVSALEANFGGVAARIRSMPLHVVVGDLETGADIDETQVSYSIGSNDLHILPAIEGAGGRTGKIIIGVALLAVGVAAVGVGMAGGAALGTALTGAAFGNSLGIAASSIIMAGVGMIAMGAVGPPTTPGGLGEREQADQRPSSIYTGPLNTIEAGHPVPYVAGVGVIVGGVVIHSDLQIEQLM